MATVTLSVGQLKKVLSYYKDESLVVFWLPGIPTCIPIMEAMQTTQDGGCILGTNGSAEDFRRFNELPDELDSIHVDFNT